MSSILSNDLLLSPKYFFVKKQFCKLHLDMGGVYLKFPELVNQAIKVILSLEDDLGNVTLADPT